MPCSRTFRNAIAVVSLLSLLLTPCIADKKKKAAPQPPWPELLLDGGRKLTYQQTYTSERDVRGNPGFWGKLTNVVIGERDFKSLGRPFAVAMDSRGRMIVTDPALGGVHIFDIPQHKYKFIERLEKGRESMTEPQCVAVDSKDNIYVTDSVAGKVFVFEPSGKSRRIFGNLKGGEGFFKRPTGIAIDPATQHVYVTDTLRNRVFILDSEGRVLKDFGRFGSGDGEFNVPTQIDIRGETVAVVDSMNFRVELFDREGNYKGAIGTTGDPSKDIYRPKGIAIDSEDHIYLVEAEWGTVQIFDREGHLLYRFGNGTGFGRFLLPSGVFIDKSDRVFVVDSYNRRVQVFQYHALSR